MLSPCHHPSTAWAPACLLSAEIAPPPHGIAPSSRVPLPLSYAAAGMPPLCQNRATAAWNRTLLTCSAATILRCRHCLALSALTCCCYVATRPHLLPARDLEPRRRWPAGAEAPRRGRGGEAACGALRRGGGRRPQGLAASGGAMERED